MLVLSRKVGERILVGDDVIITIVRTGHAVRIGVDAPNGTTIIREELKKNAALPQRAAAAP